MDKKRKIVKVLKNEIEKSLNTLREVEIKKRNIVERGDKIIELSREIISAVHVEDQRLSRSKMEELIKNLKEFNSLVKESKLLEWGYVTQVYQEALEAMLLFSIINEVDLYISRYIRKFPKLSVLLGISDLIGEIRRIVLRELMKGNLENAKIFTEIMLELFDSLQKTPLADSVAPGFRRKLDINRITLENTMSELTQEARKLELQKRMDRLLNALNMKG